MAPNTHRRVLFLAAVLAVSASVGRAEAACSARREAGNWSVEVTAGNDGVRASLTPKKVSGAGILRVQYANSELSHEFTLRGKDPKVKEVYAGVAADGLPSFTLGGEPPNRSGAEAGVVYVLELPKQEGEPFLASVPRVDIKISAGKRKWATAFDTQGFAEALAAADEEAEKLKKECGAPN